MTTTTTRTAVTYTDPGRILATSTDRDQPRQRTASGYGRKLPTRYRLRYVGPDGRPRWHRVYVMVYSNVGSPYIVSAGRELFLDTDTEHRLSDVSA